MKDTIRESLLEEVDSYADHTPPAGMDLIDSSLGVNPYGFPPLVRQVLHDFDADRLSTYSQNTIAQDAVVQYWQDLAHIELKNVFPTDGSISALTMLLTVLSRPGNNMVCFAPAFTNVLEFAHIIGIEVDAVAACAAERHRENVDALLGHINDDTALVYIDNPNNPTGQFLSQADLKKSWMCVKSEASMPL